MSFEIDPDGMAGSGRDMEAVAEHLAEVLEAFSAKISGYADAPGNDEIGGLIGDAHQAVFEFAMESFGGAAEGIGLAGQDIGGSAQAYAEAEESIKQSIEKYDKSLER
ncbi:hypothetical protein AB0I28_35500 [Phytomonospora sp. NPDC050363]|uniref:hypothetical protein n=1 Tax=Phytomonospora sp. NPDC050363 TaxID=3155642 RepID=UPI0033DEBC15